MAAMRARRGMSLSQAKKHARKLGAAIEGIHATGEVRFSFRHGGMVIHNNRKKDASCKLITELRKA
jgi:hypothetical protein